MSTWSTMRARLLGALLTPFLLAPSLVSAQDPPAPTSVPDTAELIDPIARLQEALDRGETAMEFDSVHGYLPALLERLGIPVSSQGLVFSRTSLQTDRIAPWTPRAIYFNDDVYVGWVQESPFIEIAAVDPDEGGVFYTLNQNTDSPPKFQREGTTCLMCHESRSVTGGVPGFMVLSALTDRHGYVITQVSYGPQSDRTPMEERMGGWYVTGLGPGSRHAGNAIAPVLSHEVSDQDRYVDEFDFQAHAVDDISERFDVTQYLTHESDAVAQMVLTHQTRVHNLIAAAHLGTAEALREQAATLRIRGDSVPADGLLPVTRVRLENLANRLVDGLLFAHDAPFPEPLGSESRFVSDFEALGPRDSAGRSLRDFDLEDRLFRYPLSFLIYSEAFRVLPELMKDMVYERLGTVLLEGSAEEKFAHLDAEKRGAILEIVTETLPELAATLERPAEP